MGDKVTSIAPYAFQNCGTLTTVTIGSGLQKIGTDAFSNCTGLSTINYRGSASDWAEIQGANFSGVTINYNYKD